jgi:hypothetical protein
MRSFSSYITISDMLLIRDLRCWLLRARWFVGAGKTVPDGFIGPIARRRFPVSTVMTDAHAGALSQAFQVKSVAAAPQRARHPASLR